MHVCIYIHIYRTHLLPLNSLYFFWMNFTIHLNFYPNGDDICVDTPINSFWWCESCGLVYLNFFGLNWIHCSTCFLKLMLLGQLVMQKFDLCSFLSSIFQGLWEISVRFWCWPKCSCCCSVCESWNASKWLFHSAMQGWRVNYP